MLHGLSPQTFGVSTFKKSLFDSRIGKGLNQLWQTKFKIIFVPVSLTIEKWMCHDELSQQHIFARLEEHQNTNTFFFVFAVLSFPKKKPLAMHRKPSMASHPQGDH